MSRPRILDLFAGAGGAAMGYHRAGFEVVGVDINPQPRYPFEFVQADALSILRGMRDYPTFSGEMWRPGYFAAIHASPPCQDHSPLSALVGKHGTGHYLTDTRAILDQLSLPYVIENVMGADMRPDLVLCGSMFGLRTYRHRRFEISGFPVMAIPHPRHTVLTATKSRRERWAAGWNVSVTGDVGTYVGPEAMGIDWMNGNELCQAIPPAYTEFLGGQLLAALAVAA